VLNAPGMLWRTDKLGSGIHVSSDGSSVSRDAPAGWATQLADEWLFKDVTTVILEWGECSGEAFVGVVGRNFNPSPWDVSLNQSTQAVVLDVSTGRFTYKGAKTSFVARKLTSGARLQLIIDMQTREMTTELLGERGEVISSLSVEGLPGEVALAVSFGPGKQAVRLAESATEKPELELKGKMSKDLWDDENVIEPLPLNVKKNEPSQLKAKAAEIAMALSLDL